MPDCATLTFLDPADERWLPFVASNPQANIFHHPAWANLMAECYGYRSFVAAVCDGRGQVCAGLPMMEIDSLLTGRRWVSLPWTDHCAPLYRDAASLECLIDGLVGLVEGGRTPRIELRCALPTLPGVHSYSHHFLHTVQLSSDFEQVARRFRRRVRRNVKTAKNNGVRIERSEEPEQLREFYRLHLQTRRSKGLPVQPRRFFDLLGSALFKQGLGSVLLAYDGDQCIAAAVLLHWQQTLTIKYAASSKESRSLCPSDLIVSSAIRWGCEEGYQLCDHGRCDVENTGLRAFKQGYGCEEERLVYSVLSAKPPQETNGKLMRPLQTAIRNSPAWVCRAAGELLYRHFG